MVVIAVLTAVTVVAYNGVTKRATNSIILSNVNAVQKSLLAYKELTGSFPIPDSQYQYSGENILFPVCLSTDNSDGHYCETKYGSASAGAMNGVNINAVADNLRDKMTAANVFVPKENITPGVTITSNDGSTAIYSGVMYKYYFTGIYAENIGVFIAYAQNGRSCAGGDVEIDSPLGAYTKSAAAFNATTSDSILCQRLVGKSLR